MSARPVQTKTWSKRQDRTRRRSRSRSKTKCAQSPAWRSAVPMPKPGGPRLQHASSAPRRDRHRLLRQTLLQPAEGRGGQRGRVLHRRSRHEQPRRHRPGRAGEPCGRHRPDANEYADKVAVTWDHAVAQRQRRSRSSSTATVEGNLGPCNDRPGRQYPTAAPAPGGTRTLHGGRLAPGTQYTFEVRAVNGDRRRRRGEPDHATTLRADLELHAARRVQLSASRKSSPRAGMRAETARCHHREQRAVRRRPDDHAQVGRRRPSTAG